MLRDLLLVDFEDKICLSGALMTVIEELKDLMTPGMDFEKPVREDGVTLE